MKDAPVIVAYGGGLNSAAMLCGMKDRGIVPALILFADTKSEHPATYQHVQMMDGFTRLWWGIPIITVTALFGGKHEGLEAECLRKSILPALAYASKACSQKHKIEPQTRYLKTWMTEHGVFDVRRAIGYDAGEGHRNTGIKSQDLKRGRTAHNWFPLIEWQWRRKDCEEVVKAHGIPTPRKSSCFFCPASKPSEIFDLRDNHPDLLARALAIEDAAQKTVTTKRGLGGQGVLWREWLKADAAQFKLDLEPVHIPCGCADWGKEEDSL